MSFKCGKCGKQIKKGQQQFKNKKYRTYLTEEDGKAEQISKEKKVCYNCWEGKKK